MPIYNISGIGVDFPFEAYDCQLVYMEKVIQALQTKSNALLESPTGTGKTLCLLCATLAWRKSLGSFSKGWIKSEQNRDSSSQNLGGSFEEPQSSGLPPIVYTSRTHSQIRQVIQELKRTNYRPKMVVLGSREQLCIHDDVRLLHGKAQTNACHSLCKKRTKRYCAHFSRVGDFLKHNPSLGDEPLDIEDLVNIGRSSGPCPYYLSRELHKGVDILFAPYNYLIDRGYRKTLKIQWDNSILIFDEAHNLEGLCADAASFDLPSSLLTACITEAKTCVDLSITRRENSDDKSYNPDNFAILRALLLKLEKRIAEVPIGSKELGFTKPGPYIYELLADLNVNQGTSAMLIDIIDDATVILEEDANGKDGGGSEKVKGSICRLETMGDILRLIFRSPDNAHAKHYRVHIQEVEGSGSDAFKGKTSRTLSWWCFNPGIAMEEFSKLSVGSIILTSGTLSPMDSFADELKLDFPIRLENPHVITENQIWAGIIPCGPSGYSFNSSYRCRESLEYKKELGNAIVNFARIVPDGLLVFFPSYYLLEQCIGCWKTNDFSNLANSASIWERICKHKLPVVEPRQSSLFTLSIEDYMSKLKSDAASGAVFFAVCRGKVSEGLDFADHAGRAVIVTGIPYATRNDPKVRLKREFLDEQARSHQLGHKALTGEEWYNQQATRAVNQAVGRVIRHRHDYGAIIFCDERFVSQNRQSQISRWIRPYIKCYNKFGEVAFTLTRFFRDGGVYGPTKLELAQNIDQEIVNRLEGSQSMDKLRSQKLLEPAATEVGYSIESVSLKQKPHKDFVNLEEVVPANRSSLTSEKTAESLSLQQMNYAKVGSLIAPCSLKKPKLEPLDPERTDQFAKSRKLSSFSKNASLGQGLSGVLKKERVEWMEKSGKQYNQDRKRQLEGDTSQQSCGSGSSDPKNKVACSSSTSCQDEGNNGSAFLGQVREKLTDSEYKDFVNLMKALKAKTLKISQVLQSIANLFSIPDRLCLLHRFKDYIPAKYHTLYDQYVVASSNTDGVIFLVNVIPEIGRNVRGGETDACFQQFPNAN